MVATFSSALIVRISFAAETRSSCPAIGFVAAPTRTASTTLHPIPIERGIIWIHSRVLRKTTITTERVSSHEHQDIRRRRRAEPQAAGALYGGGRCRVRRAVRRS